MVMRSSGVFAVLVSCTRQRIFKYRLVDVSSDTPRSLIFERRSRTRARSASTGSRRGNSKQDAAALWTVAGSEKSCSSDMGCSLQGGENNDRNNATSLLKNVK